jgi:hypothetical protein
VNGTKILSRRAHAVHVLKQTIDRVGTARENLRNSANRALRLCPPYGFTSEYIFRPQNIRAGFCDLHIFRDCKLIARVNYSSQARFAGICDTHPSPDRACPPMSRAPCECYFRAFHAAYSVKISIPRELARSLRGRARDGGVVAEQWGSRLQRQLPAMTRWGFATTPNSEGS